MSNDDLEECSNRGTPLSNNHSTNTTPAVVSTEFTVLRPKSPLKRGSSGLHQNNFNPNNQLNNNAGQSNNEHTIASVFRQFRDHYVRLRQGIKKSSIASEAGGTVSYTPKSLC